MEGLKHAKTAVGSKQVKKAIQKGIAQKVYIAQDAEPHIIRPLIELCQENSIEVVLVTSMEELGKACGIAVGSASAALLNE